MSLKTWWIKRIITTKCVCESHMPPIMANSKDGQGHKDKYFDTVGRSCHKKCSCAIWKL